MSITNNENMTPKCLITIFLRKRAFYVLERTMSVLVFSLDE